MPDTMLPAGTANAQILPQYPAKLEAGERVYPIRFAIRTPQPSDEQAGPTVSVVDSSFSSHSASDLSTAPTSSDSREEHLSLHNSHSNVKIPSPVIGRGAVLVTEKHEYAVLGESTHGVIHGARRQFQSCEDEPIHIPGAIQSFGILIALQFTEKDTLEVRIASENCADFCQYSVADLFRLENFLQVFPDYHRTQFEAKAWYIRDQYLRTQHETEPIVFSTAMRNLNGLILPLKCAIHFIGKGRNLLVCEFEYQTTIQPSSPASDPDLPPEPVNTLDLDASKIPEGDNNNAILPLELHRLVRALHHDERSTTETVSLMSQIQQQLTACETFAHLLDKVVSIVQQLTRFHRVMVYEFDKSFNGKVVAEIIDPKATVDLYKGLQFPASDIPAQARKLYQINKVRLLFDREKPSARLVCRTIDDLATPLDLTHSYLRAMSPIHLKYLGNMGVRSTASISLEHNNNLWGLICCHSYGPTATHVSFSVREVCYWIGLCASNCIAKLSYTTRLGARKLLETIHVDKDPQRCVTASSNDMLRLFNSNSGFMIIQGEARTIGKHDSYQEAVAILQYVHFQGFKTTVATSSITRDYSNFLHGATLKTIAGFLFIPLSEDSDYILFLRNHQIKEVHWAGNPHEKELAAVDTFILQPRASFKKWTETVLGSCKDWTEDESREFAATVRLVYGKFIEVWRANERTVLSSRMKRILLLNASHEARTPLNAIINYLEIAMENILDEDTKELLRKSHSASQSLVYIIDDLLNLTRSQDGSFPLLESGFDVKSALQEALRPLESHASRKGLNFEVVHDPNLPQFVRGDFQRFQQAVVHIVSNAIRCTAVGKIQIEAKLVQKNSSYCLILIQVQDTGMGIFEDDLDEIFQDLEQIPSDDGESPKPTITASQKRAGTPVNKPKLGLGLATVARFTRLRGGLLTIKSQKHKGTTVSMRLPFPIDSEASHPFQLPTPPVDIIAALTSSSSDQMLTVSKATGSDYALGFFDPPKDSQPVPRHLRSQQTSPTLLETGMSPARREQPMVIIVADDNTINLQILQRRLERMGHRVYVSGDGQQCYDSFSENSSATQFILMDLDMPLVDGYVSTEMIRDFEKMNPTRLSTTAHAYGRTPIFAVSASLKPNHLDKIVKSGFDGWVVKPVNFNRLNMYLLGAYSPNARKDALYDPADFLLGGWFDDSIIFK